MSSSFTATDVRGIFGIIPTPSTPDAGSWQAADTVDLVTTTQMVQRIAPDVDALMNLGTFGEGATVTEAEALAFTKAVVDAAGTVPVFAGATTLNTRDTISRARKLLDVGARGLFLGRPMWVQLDEDSIVGYYSDIAEAFPETPVILYDNPEAFKGKISPTTYARLAKIPTLVAAKYTVLGPSYQDDVAACGDDLVLLPMDADWYQARQLVGDRAAACWSPNAASGMHPLVALREAIRHNESTTAADIAARIKTSFDTLFPTGGFTAFSTYNIPLDKARIAAAGLIDPGPVRPPYAPVPDDYRAGAVEAGRRWAALEQEFASRLQATNA
ncbi:MAG: dihydrodipicolinate synthase family protein [Microbacterium sp.]|uniref:dihydrodipicolinate synthase family protein n=1 Tax=Microbacterium sp. TaxID=51671 RepID=UPI00271D7BAC|nr:dihydrodipicolinate synthase family protein [Microbacterium sp.]MDO8383847.1 dihydrodipicolinate synthase family protein [Microbacterium sp.]